MPTKAEIELAKAVMVLVNGTIRECGTTAYLHIDLNEIIALAESEPDDVAELRDEKLKTGNWENS